MRSKNNFSRISMGRGAIWRINLLSFILPCCSRFKLFSSDFETGEAGVFVFRCQVTHSGILRLGLPFLELKYKGWSISVLELKHVFLLHLYHSSDIYLVSVF